MRAFYRDIHCPARSVEYKGIGREDENYSKPFTTVSATTNSLRPKNCSLQAHGLQLSLTHSKDWER